MSEDGRLPKLTLMFSDDDVWPEGTVRMFRPLYGGDVASPDGRVVLPFVLRKELVAVDERGSLLRIVEPAVERVAPQCVHFGGCGGCQYQMQRPDAQVTDKRRILSDLLEAAGVDLSLGGSFEIPAHAGEPYGYRNRIRLRVERVEGALRFGYNVRGTAGFLPVAMCPIAAPVLWGVAEGLLAVGEENPAAADWLDAATDVELFVDDALAKVQITLFCPPRTALPAETFAIMMDAVSERMPEIVGAGAVGLDAKSGLTGKVFAAWGAAGLNYRVGDEIYWISRGGFFQVNRFLLPTLVEIVTAGRAGSTAWDLFAGVGLFSRVLAKTFAQVTAVEANPVAARDLAVGLKKVGTQHRAVEKTTLEFLRAAAVERERPELVVIDPPRAGAGVEACELMARIGPRAIVYVSCDPTTLARDWKVLERSGYRATAAHLVDLFPQTFHMETVVVFER